MELKRKFSKYSLENKFYWQLQFVNAIREDAEGLVERRSLGRLPAWPLYL